MVFVNVNAASLQTGRFLGRALHRRRFCEARSRSPLGTLMVMPPVSRRAFLAAFAAGVTGIVLARASPSWADGAVSRATRERARGQYGPRVLATQAIIDRIEQAANAGNLELVAALTANPKKISKKERKELESLDGFGALYAERNAFLLLKGAVRGDRVREPEMDRVVDRLFATADEIYQAARIGNRDKVLRSARNLPLYLNSVITVAEVNPRGPDAAPGQAFSSDFDWRRGRVAMHLEESAAKGSSEMAAQPVVSKPSAPAPAPAPAPEVSAVGS